MTETPEYILRTKLPQDENFIYASWARGYQETIPATYIPTALYTSHQNSHIKRCLNQFTTHMIVFPDDPNEYFGFINYSMFDDILMLHWLYIKSDHRKKGIARDIIKTIYPNHQSNPIVITQFSKFFTDLQSKFNLVFDPYFLLEH